MNEVKVSFDKKSYFSKPEGKTIARISERIGSQTVHQTLNVLWEMWG